MSSFGSWIRRHQVAVTTSLILAGVLGFGLWHYHSSRPDPRVLAIRQQGYPTSLSELDAWYLPVPDRSNAALVYLRAFAMLGTTGITEHVTALTQPEDQAPTDREIEAHLEVLQPLLDLLKSVPPDAPARYPIDFSLGLATLLPHLKSFKPAVIVLGAEARLRAHQGDGEGAIKALGAARNVADSLRNEPVLVSQLVYIACCAITLRDLEHLLGSHTWSVSQLESLRQMVKGMKTADSFQRGIAAERSFGLAAFQDPKMTAALLGMNPGGGSQPGLGATATINVLRGVGALGTDKTYYLKTMKRYVDAAEKTFPDRWELGHKALDEEPGRMLLLSRTLLPDLNKAFLRDAEAVARARAAECAIEVEKFRVTHGNTIPETLNHLPANVTSTLPRDPFTGKPFRYRKTDHGYVVYSVGSNRKDDGGFPPVPSKKKNASGLGADVCFSVSERP